MVRFTPLTLDEGVGACFSIPDRFADPLGHTRGYAAQRLGVEVAKGAGRHTDKLGEARREGAERAVADGETHVGHRQVAAPQEVVQMSSRSRRAEVISRKS